MAAAPATPPPARVSSEDILSQKTDVCISNAIVKAGLGLSGGVVLSAILFRRRAFPVWLGLGGGLGAAYADCQRLFNPAAIPGYRVLDKGEAELLFKSGASSGTAAAGAEGKHVV